MPYKYIVHSGSLVYFFLVKLEEQPIIKDDVNLLMEHEDTNHTSEPAFSDDEEENAGPPPPPAEEEDDDDIPLG